MTKKTDGIIQDQKDQANYGKFIIQPKPQAYFLTKISKRTCRIREDLEERQDKTDQEDRQDITRVLWASRIILQYEDSRGCKGPREQTGTGIEQGQEDRQDYMGIRGHTGVHRPRGRTGIDKINRAVWLRQDKECRLEYD
jgi:hypothetical protein